MDGEDSGVMVTRSLDAVGEMSRALDRWPSSSALDNSSSENEGGMELQVRILLCLRFSI
jgi:hypothetical protein